MSRREPPGSGSPEGRAGTESDGWVDGEDDRGDREDPDDLAGFSSPLRRLLRAARPWLAALVALALLVPAGADLVEELVFRRTADAVVATLAGERAGAAAAETVLLVRAIGCGGGASSGTAFVVATEAGPALLTNRHVVAGARTVGVRSLDGDTSTQVTGVRLSDSADVAVLEVAEPAALPPPLALASTPVEMGAEVRLVGFPAATPFTDAGAVSAVTADRLLLELEVAAGASGSPVVAADGQVVGQVHSVTRDGAGVATPAARLPDAIAEATAAPGC